MVTIVRPFEQPKTKYMKTEADIKFIKSCKTANVIPKFANVNLSTQYGSYKLKKLTLTQHTYLFYIKRNY